MQRVLLSFKIISSCKRIEFDLDNYSNLVQGISKRIVGIILRRVKALMSNTKYFYLLKKRFLLNDNTLYDVV